jgi:tRNA (guanine37-N1)-methyltransferase
MEIHFITIFPDMFVEPLCTGVLGIAAKKGAASYGVVNLRDFSKDRHPYGGGPGMVMMAPTIVEAVEAITSPDEIDGTAVILLTPCGEVFDQAKALTLSHKRKLVFICGRYKGVDERVSELVVGESISIGDFVTSGGELPALVVADAIVRCLPGVLGDERSRETDSFTPEREFSLDAAYYTRPPEFRGLKVPEVLLSGNHAKIEQWRRESALERTRKHRPDLLKDREGGAGDGD